MNQELNINEIDEFITFLFHHPPLIANQVQFDWSEMLVQSKQPLEDLFQSLLEIWTKGMSYLYGDSQGKVNLDELQTEQAQTMESYFNSFGFTIYYQKTLHNDTLNPIGRWITPSTNDCLQTRVLRINSTIALYEFAFDVLN